MPALIDIRRRIRSVKSTQQITKAMKMVSAAKLRRAQEAMFAARPYARKMMEVLNSMASRATPDAHPLLQERGHEKVLLVVITADKGLCGAFNANIIRTATRFLADRGDGEVELALVGRKARDFFRRRTVKVRSERVGAFQALRYQTRAGAGRRSSWRPSPAGRRTRSSSSTTSSRASSSSGWSIDRLLPIERHALRPQEPSLDYLYEPEPAGDLRHHPPEARRGPGLAGAPRVERGRARRAHDRRWTPPPTTPRR